MIDTRDSYRPGEKNINQYEAQLRRESGVLHILIAISAVIFLKVIKAEPFWYLIILVPITLSALGFLQSYFRFCANYAFRGIQNAARSIDEPSNIMSKEARSRDVGRARKMLFNSITIALVVTLAVTIFVA